MCVKSTLRTGASRLLSKKAHDLTNFSCHRFDSKRVLTTPHAVVWGQRKRVLWTVPLLRSELAFTLLYPTLCAHSHAAGIGQIGLG